MKTFNKAFYFPLLFLFLLFNLSSSLSAWVSSVGDDAPANSAVELDIDNDFHLLFGGQTNRIFGDIAATGDTMLYVPDAGYTALYDVTSTYMLTDANNTFQNATDLRKRNSSQGSLNLPNYVEGKNITFAGLFWQGFIHENGISTTADVDAAVSGWNQATFKTPDGIEHSITADTSTKDVTNKTYHYAYKDSDSFHFHYSAYVDVTSMVKATYSSSTNTFTLGNVLTTAGKDWGDNMYFSYGNGGDGTGTGTDDGNWGSARMGYYSGWALVVVYAVDPATASANSVDYKTVSVFDGFDQFLIWDENQQLLIDIDIDNFLTPKEGDLNSTLLLFGGAGDYGIGNDVLQIYNPDTASFETISNSVNTSGHQFNSSYTDTGTHMTSKHIRNGVDLDIFDVSSHMAHKQTTTKIKFGVERQTGSADQIFPQVLAFSTKLYEPVFCYDYAYQQQKVYFTEDNDGSQDPKITGDVIVGEDINVTIFIRNLVDSDLEVKNMIVNITDINTTQATYISDSVYLNKTGELHPTLIDDSLLDIGSDYIKDIPVGDMASNGYFYIYYGLDPSEDTLDMPIKVNATYDLVIDGNTTIPYLLTVGANLQMCSSTNFKYTPTKGQFNIVHDLYYTSPSDYYNNLPTVITQRADNYTVLSYDKDDANFTTLVDTNTSVYIELIDASAFHDTFASCKEASSSISEKILVVFEDNKETSFNAQDIIATFPTADGTGSNPDGDKDFYRTAKENAAFRISWTNDLNDSTIGVDGNETTGYHLTNFSDYATMSCKEPVTTDVDSGATTVTKTYTQVPQACANAGTASASAMNKKELAACLQCIYGYNTKYICSRDNFSIRPEAFLMHLDDQNQTDTTSQSRLTTGQSGVSGATATPLALAAGYEYNIEVNATNHYTNDASYGYTKTMNVTDDNSTALYIWDPSNTVVSGACNDEDNKTITMRFVNGVVDKNTSVGQVGQYKLNIKDTTWTTVDSNPTFMTHHDGDSYFLDSSNPDCIHNSTVVSAVAVPPALPTLNGCNISSKHSNTVANLKYNDYNITFHPYEFSVLIAPRIGLNNIIPPTTNPFIYMADISVSQDENMSVKLNAFITAKGKNSPAGLSNFVTGCYAKPLDINISNQISAFPQPLRYRYNLKDYNNTSGLRIPANDINSFVPEGTMFHNRDINITTTNNFFIKDMSGSISTKMYLNFTREVNASANPIQVKFITYNVSDTNNIFNADLNSNSHADGYADINKSTTQRLDITHYYGRTAAKKTTVICDKADILAGTCSANDTLNKPTPKIFYEVFCNGTVNGNTCDPLLLPTDLSGNILQKVDSRWFISLDHNITNYGELNVTNETINNYVTVPVLTYQNPYTLNSVHTYDMSDDLPYTTTMLDSVPNWLLHNENNASATTNSHIIIFRPTTEWSGEHEADSTTKTDRVQRVNRRTMW